MCPSRDSPSTCASRMLRTCRSGRRLLPILHLPLHEEGCAISNQFLAISNVNRSTENPIGLLSYTTGYTNNWTIASGREARLVHDDACGPGCPVQPTSKLSFDVAPQRMLCALTAAIVHMRPSTMTWACDRCLKYALPSYLYHFADRTLVCLLM